MTDMTDEEALKVLTRGFEGGDYQKIGEAICVAMNNLAGKVAREKEAKPKRASLEEIEASVICGTQGNNECNRCGAGGFYICCQARQADRIAAADILRALREDTIPEILGMAKDCNTSAASAWADARLRALGEVP